MRGSKSVAVLPLRRAERAPLSVAVSRQIRDAIVSGKVAAGAALPSEKELGLELGVGRSTVREALRILQAQGLVSGGDTVSTHRPRVATEETLSVAAAQSLENVVRLGQVPLDDLVALRVVIEGAALEEAARHGRSPALRAARDALAEMEGTSVDVERFRAADLAFHRSLAAASGNLAFPLVMGVLRGAIASHLGEALHRVKSPSATMQKLAREHRAILDAIERRDGERARALVTSHVRGFYRAKKST